MKLKITAWQRFQCIQAVGGLRGNVAILHLGGKLLDILQFSDEDKEKVGYQELPTGAAAWRDATAAFDIEIKDGNQGDLLKRALEQREDWPVANSGQVFDLLEQVGATIAEPEPEGD